MTFLPAAPGNAAAPAPSGPKVMAAPAANDFLRNPLLFIYLDNIRGFSMRTKLTYILACLLATVQHTDAQQYLFARYTSRDGLVNNRARFFFQDTRGRLYISTFGGLSVYDGSRFINYTTEEGLATSLINDIVEMGEDSLWIIPNGSALHCLVRGVLRNIKTADNFYPVTNQLVHCSDGHWYSIADQGFFRFENNRFIRIRPSDSAGGGIDQSLIQAVEVNRQLIILKDPNL